MIKVVNKQTKFNFLLFFILFLIIFIQLINLKFFLIADLINTGNQPVDNSPEIYGWYCIDWGKDYFENDFEKISKMNVDGVFLRSYDKTFEGDPESFSEAISKAREKGLKVGIITFHPFDEDYQRTWGLPIHQGEFSDFSANRTWIEQIYQGKLINMVQKGELLNITYYVYDDITLDLVANTTNAKRFLNITDTVTDGQCIMLSHFPPKEDQDSYQNYSVKNWDWYTAPENIESIKNSAYVYPSCDTLGQFVWLHKRTDIEVNELQELYRALLGFDRIEIFTLRYGKPSWDDGLSNSILENENLVKKITELNLYFKRFARLSDFNQIFSINSNIIYPSINQNKPLNCSVAEPSDWLASAFISTKLENFTEALDTNNEFINQTLGYPVDKNNLITVGGPMVNVVVRYYEKNKITPLIYEGLLDTIEKSETWSQWYFPNGTAIIEAAIDTNEHNDIFLIECFKDDKNRNVFIIYGIDWRGTYAAGKFFDSVLFPRLEEFPFQWILVKWEDTNLDGYVNLPRDGDSYIILRTGK